MLHIIVGKSGLIVTQNRHTGKTASGISRNATRLGLGLATIVAAMAIHFAGPVANVRAGEGSAGSACVIACNPKTKLCSGFNIWRVPRGYIRIGSTNIPAGYKRSHSAADCTVICGLKKTVCK